MLYFTMFLIFLTMFMFIYVVLVALNKGKMSIENRLEQIKDIQKVSYDTLEDTSFSERAIKPFYNAFTKFLMKASTKNKLISMNKKLEKAGLLKNSTTEKWIYTKSMITIIVSLLFGILAYLIEANILKAMIISSIIVLFINVIFNFYLAKKIKLRKAVILRDLPFTIDLITVCVEAGLSFDGAMVRVVNNLKGELCDEFARNIKEIRMGIQRKIALRNMSERCEVRELSMLITSLIQADEMGISLGKVLRIEAANLREQRKQVAREKAMKAPIKMLFPLIFFIFPSIFIIILGPAVIKILMMFS